MTTSFPPHYHHSSARIAPSHALALLSSFLQATTTDPSLHPNALLTENGPITPSSGTNTGLVLHNLKRVEAGLRGEHLTADLLFKDFGGEGLPGLMHEGVENAVKSDKIGVTHPDGTIEAEWQDREDFEREQEVVVGEVGKRDNAPEEWEEETERTTIKPLRGRVEKEDRRIAKKERQRKAKQEKEAKRKREKDAEG